MERLATLPRDACDAIRRADPNSGIAGHVKSKAVQHTNAAIAKTSAKGRSVVNATNALFCARVTVVTDDAQEMPDFVLSVR